MHGRGTILSCIYMDKIGLFEAIDQENEYRKMLPRDRVQLRKKKLYELVTYARENSPLYKELYKDLPVNFTIQDLPHTNRKMLQDRYDDWSTDREVTLEKVMEYIKGEEKDRPFLKKYRVAGSGGTSGRPLITLFDDNCMRIMSVSHMFRSIPRREQLISFILHHCRIASIYSSNRAYFPALFAANRRRYLPLSRRRSLVLSSQSDTEELVSALNKFKPSILAGFPSVLSRLAFEQESGRLHIHPVCIMADGEYLSTEVRSTIASAFECDVHGAYMAAEAGVIAYECREHHLHINDDRIILEPVDESGLPTEEGETAEKVLLTNLSSYPQPVIRYELGDRIILHEEECLCGNPSPWIEISGRDLDSIRLIDGARQIIIPLADLEKVLDDEESIMRYQIVIYAGSRLSLRLESHPLSDKTMAFFKAEKLLRSYMRSVGVLSPMITLDKDEPLPDPITGRFNKIIIE